MLNMITNLQPSFVPVLVLDQQGKDNSKFSLMLLQVQQPFRIPRSLMKVEEN